MKFYNLEEDYMSSICSARLTGDAFIDSGAEIRIRAILDHLGVKTASENKHRKHGGPRWLERTRQMRSGTGRRGVRW